MKTALVMEGGAMRGMFTCGVIDVLMENGITFDGAAGISAGAVFMGALTYIGNAPNFMVKSIAERGKVKMPSFFGYTVEGGSVEVGKASTDAVVTSSVLILFSDVFLTQLLS